MRPLLRHYCLLKKKPVGTIPAQEGNCMTGVLSDSWPGKQASLRMKQLKACKDCATAISNTTCTTECRSTEALRCCKSMYLCSLQALKPFKLLKTCSRSNFCTINFKSHSASITANSWHTEFLEDGGHQPLKATYCFHNICTCVCARLRVWTHCIWFPECETWSRFQHLSGNLTLTAP